MIKEFEDVTGGILQDALDSDRELRTEALRFAIRISENKQASSAELILQDAEKIFTYLKNGIAK